MTRHTKMRRNGSSTTIVAPLHGADVLVARRLLAASDHGAHHSPTRWPCRRLSGSSLHLVEDGLAAVISLISGGYAAAA